MQKTHVKNPQNPPRARKFTIIEFSAQKTAHPIGNARLILFLLERLYFFTVLLVASGSQSIMLRSSLPTFSIW